MTNGSGTKALVADNRVEEYKKLGFSAVTEEEPEVSAVTEEEPEVSEKKPVTKRKTTKKAE